MLNWRDWLSSDRASEQPAGSWLVPARRSHLASMRRMLGHEPCQAIHLAAVIDPPRREMRPDGGLWALLRNGRLIGAMQCVRGISWAFSEDHRRDGFDLGEIVDFIMRRKRRRQILLGPASQVEPLLEAIPPQAPLQVAEIRRQELMIVPFGCGAASSVGSGENASHGDAFRLRFSRPDDLDWLLQAHRAMCLEDLGVDRVARQWEAYRTYFRHLIACRRSFIGQYDTRRVFKAEIPVVGPRAELIEGVITLRDWRGMGIARSAVSEIVQQIASRGSRPCLYVRSDNTAARRLYERVGFSESQPWRTVLMSSRMR